MTSDKAYSVEQELHGLYPGPWTAFNPLINGWAVSTTFFSAAWVRYFPMFNMCFMSAIMLTGTTTDGTQIGTVPASDSAGNGLRPAQIVPIPVGTDLQRLPATGTNNEGPRLHLGSGGAITVFGIATGATLAEVAAWYPLDAM